MRDHLENLTCPKAIFFDWDGTLVDSIGFLLNAHNFARTFFDRAPMTLTEFEPYFGMPREKLYAEMYGAANIEEAKIHFEKYVHNHHLTDLKAIDGAATLLEFIHKHEIPMGLVSNKRRIFLEAEANNYDWGQYFISVVGSGDAKEDKPSAAPLHLAIQKAGLEHLPTQDIWYIGDTDTDLKCAQSYGCPCILIKNTITAPQMFEEYKHTAVFQSLDAFYKNLMKKL